MKESGESPKRSGMMFMLMSQIPTQIKMVTIVAAVCIIMLSDLIVSMSQKTIFVGHRQEFATIPPRYRNP
tara:strand:+ start:1243 stop:1452 length:210 start_codon:yes stop_codon:yes gene_type:complete